MNGPALDADGPRVAVAWFTKGADGVPRVLLARSEDAGQTFGPPIRIAERAALGRAAVALLPDGGAAVAWLDEEGGAARLRLRRAGKDGALSPALDVASVLADRSSGFPRLARAGAGLVLAWTDPSRGPRLRTALVSP